MAIYGAFSAVTLGLLGQSHAINTIGTNIANVNTGGYKRTDTQFQTVLSRALFEQSDLGGIKPLDVQRVDVQGQLVATANDLDLAINGAGFFIVSPTITPGNQLFYTRDGSFQVRVGRDANGAPTDEGFITDKNGFYLLGWEPDDNGVFPTGGSGSLQALRVDHDFFADTFETTTEATIGLNLPANNPVIANHANAVAQFNSGTTPAGFEHYAFTIVDSNGNRQTVRLNFTKSDVNQWQVSATTEQTAVAQIDSVTLAGTIEAGDTYTVTINGTPFNYTTTGAEGDIDAVRNSLITLINNNATLPVTASAGGTGIITLTADTAGSAFTTVASATNGGATANNTATVATTTPNTPSTATTAATTLTFDGDGTPASGSPSTLNFSISTFPNGGSATFAVDISGFTQFASDFLPLFTDTNGFQKSDLTGLRWETDGRLIGNFNTEFDRALYKVPVAIFTSPNNLEAKNGNVFAETEASGEAEIFAVDETGLAEFVPGTVELSNVVLEDQFTRMIQAQAIYNASATAFKTVDEMTVVARDLKA